MTEHGVAQLISAAERHIADRKFDLALDQLTTARQLDPHNQYIRAIIDRVCVLRQETLNDSSKGRYLSVTVGSRYADGIKSAGSETPAGTGNTQARVKSLTRKAEQQLKEGSVARAFESLMSAYMIDPNNPDVLSCERKVLPVWNQLNADATTRSELNERWRLDLLKHQKEVERNEKERAMWRQASRPLAVMKDPDSPNMPQGSSAPLAGRAVPSSAKTEGGLFTKLKRGKFLG
jgi:hypothetical protein